MNSPTAPKSAVIRSPRQSARAQDAILDAVHQLLHETSVRDLAMEAVAMRASVGKPIQYKRWPFKAALVFAMFHEHLASESRPMAGKTIKETVRSMVRRTAQPRSRAVGRRTVPYQFGGPSDPDQQAIRPANPDLIQAPLAVAQYTTRPDDEVIDSRGNFVHVRRTDEDAEWVVLFWHPPRAASSLRQVHFATPTGHDDVVGVTARALKAQALPKRLGTR